MSVGFPSTKSDFDSRAGQLATGLRDTLMNWQRFYQLVTSAQWGSANLVSVAGYSSAEATTLINAATDIGGTGNSLYNIAHAAGTLPSANDFFFNAGKLTGVV